MVNTPSYSYRPSQSGIDYQCLYADGARDASWLTITTVQTVLVAIIIGGIISVGMLARRRWRNEPVPQPLPLAAPILGAMAVAATQMYRSARKFRAYKRLIAASLRTVPATGIICLTSRFTHL